MTTAIKRRRGTTAQHSTFTGLEGELTIDTTKDTVVVHDGATAGGFPLAKETGSAIAATTLSASGAFSANGGATLGDASGDALTINSSAVSIPNGLNFTSGNLGLGVTPSVWNTSWKSIGIGARSAGISSEGSVLDVTLNSFANVSAIDTYVASATATKYRQQGGQHQWYTAPSGTAGNAITFTQAMTLDAGGNLLVGKTASSGATVGFEASTAGFVSTASGTFAGWMNRTTSDGDILRFSRNATGVGSVSVTTTATAYNTSSDYRLKDNVLPMTGALATVAALKPCTYTWKSTGETSQGFIAHELQAVVPDAVTGQKDAVDAEGNPVYQGIDTSFLVATLTAAIQELKAEVDSLKSELIALKG